MSGSAHQRKVAATALASALKELGVVVPSAKVVDSSQPSSGVPDKEERLGRGSIEAYAFFIVTGVYTVVSAFGFPVNFWAGCFMAIVMTVCAVHLLWSSVWTANWAKLAKLAGSGIAAVVLLIVVNRGYVQTRRSQNPNAETLSAIQNLSALISRLPRIESGSYLHIAEIRPTYGYQPLTAGAKVMANFYISKIGRQPLQYNHSLNLIVAYPQEEAELQAGLRRALIKADNYPFGVIPDMGSTPFWVTDESRSLSVEDVSMLVTGTKRLYALVGLRWKKPDGSVDMTIDCSWFYLQGQAAITANTVMHSCR